MNQKVLAHSPDHKHNPVTLSGQLVGVE